MIKANELRVGTKFYFPFHKEIISILGYAKTESDNSFKFQFETRGGILLEPLGVLQPIELTPEILIKLGFKKDGLEGCVWYQKDFPVVGELCTSDERNPLGNFLFDTDTDTLRIYYLHQLQNLYFSLTGFELDVTL